MAQWKIGGRQALCAVCEHKFEDGERHHSMVRIHGDEIERQDGCQACWDKKEFGPVDEAAGDEHRFWWTTRHQVESHKTVAMDMDALQRLFLELQGREERNLAELRYVLCLLLMRKKRVKLERILRDDEGESFIVRRPRSDERYTVLVFDFTPERMAEIREHLQAIFDGVEGDEALGRAARGEIEEPVEGQEEVPEQKEISE